MPQRESAVVYDGLPISSGGAHAINRLDPVGALDAWRHFLVNCGHVTHLKATIRVAEAPGPPISPAVRRLLDESFPTALPTFPFLRSVPSERLEEAVSFMARIDPQPTDEWGNAAVLLQAEADFQLLQPLEPVLWPAQGRELFGGFVTPAGVRLGVSSARINIGAARSMGLMLTIPDASDADLDAIRLWLQDHLPFRLSRKH